ncbi:hypothetical protein HDU93_002231 [Gonapodya sp. JEL0774]|nr:hypothetical protein HDU93_002231 [Gonapodya sp. JEL0774]
MLTRPVLRYAIFDMDGLLIDTERCYHDAASSILRERGYELSDEINAARLGLTAYESTKLVLESTGVGLTPEDYRLELRKRQIATSSARPEFLLKRSSNPDLFALFEGRWVLGDDPTVVRGKPAPDIFLEAAKRLGVRVDVDEEKRDVFVFEDSPSGVMAALHAGMVPVWVTGSDPAFLRLIASRYRDLAGQVCDRGGTVICSLEEFKVEDWGVIVPEVLNKGTL